MSSELSDAHKIYLGPSILSADFGALAKDCQEVLEMGIQTLHIDIMDGYISSHSAISCLT